MRAPEVEISTMQPYFWPKSITKWRWVSSSARPTKWTYAFRRRVSSDNNGKQRRPTGGKQADEEIKVHAVSSEPRTTTQNQTILPV